MSYSCKLELLLNFGRLADRTSDIGRDILLPALFWNASMSTCCPCIWIISQFRDVDEYNNVFVFVKQQSAGMDAAKSTTTSDWGISMMDHFGPPCARCETSHHDSRQTN